MNYKKGTQTRGCMKSVMRYVSQLGKTLWDGQQLVSGIGCQPETASDEFLSTKLLHRKDGGVMFYHMVQSFPKGADVDPRTAHEAARQLAGYFEGCEVLVCTHVDREHIHSHCIINSVNFETGKKIHMADEQIHELRARNDTICEELGLPKFQKDEQRQSGGMSNAEYYPAAKGESWKLELMRVIDECMRCAGNREEFLILLRSEGYDATWTDSRKNITYVTPDGCKCRDSKLHIEKYLKENMEAEFGYRTENDNTRNVDAAQKADGRGTTAGTQRDGHGAELECAARNAGQAVPAADAVGCKPENAPIIFVLVYGRMLEIYMLTSLAPIPVATLSNRELGSTGQNYIKSLFAVGFQGLLILVCVAIYAVLIQGIATSGDPIGAIWGTVGYTVLLCFMLFKTGSIAQRIFGAH